MPAPTASSPNTGNYMVAKGIVSFKRKGTAEYRDMGNVTEFVFTPEVETLEHFSSREGVKKKDLVVILEQKGTVKFTMEEFTPDNVALMVLGTVDPDAVGGTEIEIFSSNAVEGALRIVGTNEVGPKMTVDLWNVSFAPNGDLGLISDEWNEMELTGDVLTGDEAPNVGKFGRIKYTNLAPEVPSDLVSLLPATGPAAGGTAVTLTGTGFLNATGATFGGTPATNFNVVSDTTITCTAPAHAAGAVAVQVTDPDGNDTLAGSYTYS
jgi:hypothetical protein